MDYVVYTRLGHKILQLKTGGAARGSLKQCQRALLRQAERDQYFDPENWKIDTVENYQLQDTEETVYHPDDKNRERPIKLKRSIVGTSMDPTTERYRSM